MRNQNISQINKRHERTSSSSKKETLRKNKFKVYKGSNKKKVTSYEGRPKLVKIK